MQYNTAAAAAKSLQSCPTLRPQRRQPTRLLRPWDFPGKSTGVGCHCLLRNIALSIIKYLLIKQWSMKNNNATIYLLGWSESKH